VGKPRQKDHEFKASLDYTETPSQKSEREGGGGRQRRKGERKEGRKEGRMKRRRKEGRRERRKEGEKEGRKEGRKENVSIKRPKKESHTRMECHMKVVCHHGSTAW
jgi:hypothetical protein